MNRMCDHCGCELEEWVVSMLDESSIICRDCESAETCDRGFSDALRAEIAAAAVHTHRHGQQRTPRHGRRV
jgi:hypothetical protein